MKSVISVPATENKAPKFPKLMININRDLIVLLSAPNEGTVVYSDGHASQVGYYCPSWNESQFRDFDGKITLGD